MLDPASSKTPTSFDPATVDDRSDAELDALAFGVICLDASGTVLRYNLYESRLARLDKNQVLGRNFFGEVAPCTKAPEFEGRFKRFAVERDRDRVTDRFEYIFDFEFGAQIVAVELHAIPAKERFYLFINRKEIRPPRSGVERARLAALQRDLAPDEQQLGVRRDGLERRFVDVPAPFFAALRATCDRIAPESWQLFASEWGVQWGRRVAVDLEGSAMEGGASLREMPMRRFAEVAAKYLADRGWGLASIDFSSAREGLLVIELERSALAESAPRFTGAVRATQSVPRDLSCHLVAGCFSGLFTYVADRRLVAREVSCASSGASRCEMLLVAHDRRGVIDAALQAGLRGVEPLREALRTAPKGRTPP